MSIIKLNMLPTTISEMKLCPSHYETNNMKPRKYQLVSPTMDRPWVVAEEEEVVLVVLVVEVGVVVLLILVVSAAREGYWLESHEDE